MKWFVALLFLCIQLPAKASSDFFEIQEIRQLLKPGKSGAGVWIRTGARTIDDDVFVPCIEAELRTKQPIRSQGLTMRAYFLNDKGDVVSTVAQPTPARESLRKIIPFAAPVLFPSGESKSVFFAIPNKLLEEKITVVIVFGDKNDLTAKRFPDGSLIGINFPEKDKVLAARSEKVERKPALDPVITEVVQTQNVKHPQITLLLRTPNKTSDVSEIKGVLALCVLANSVDSIHRELQAANSQEFSGILRFADKHKLAVLCWGARTLWRPDASYDELDDAINKQIDRDFNDVADAWERGVLRLSEKYGLPKDQFFLWGYCGSAQWAHRLALRKPEYFMAAFLHIPSSFDRPTPDGAKILWLLTTGELDGGYQRGIRWFRDCTEAGYPIIFKAVQSLGHASSPVSDDLGMKFFEYAFSLRDQRTALDRNWDAWKKKSESLEKKRPWLEDFANPQFVGDLQNQEVFPSKSRDFIPPALRVPLPNQTLATSWNK